jgi:hypothetical protein
MRSSRNTTSRSTSPLDNAFSPSYLELLRERDDSITAAEAELAGPWKIEPVPGRPGAVAILRVWEDLAIGDPPVAVLWHLETARLLSVLLPVIDREPLFHLEEQEKTEGFPLVAVYGEQRPQESGWLDRYEPRWAEGLHLLEAIVRSPWALATLLEAAGPGAEEQVGRIRARRVPA